MFENKLRLRTELIGAPLFFAALMLLGSHRISAQETKQQTSAPNEAHFHHLHLNTLDPKGAIDFYTGKFDCEKAKFAGLLDGVWSQKSWILFTKVATPPKSDLDSAIWHFG